MLDFSREFHGEGDSLADSGRESSLGRPEGEADRGWERGGF